MSKDTQPVTMTGGPVVCIRCGNLLEPLVIEEISGVLQLRAGKVLFSQATAQCMTPDCGWTFRWNIREKDVEKMTIMYSALVERIKGYTPE